MFIFLIPLLTGFAITSLSTFTTFFSTHFGDRKGRLIVIILRDVLGMPILIIGYALAIYINSPILFTPTAITSALAWLLIVAGALVILGAVVSIRWKSLAPSMKDTLVEKGPYRYVRHPVYSGVLLELVGLSMWILAIPVMVACLLGILWIIIQARLEELDLIQRLPAYKDYMQRVPRFIPGLH
jgi:protein-S-isoprenylcysteine O-methyltransferase Ste14